MGILFKKREKKTVTSGNTSILSAKLDASRRKIQAAWARRMEQWTANFSPRKWKIALGLFVLFTGGCNVLLVTGRFRSDHPWLLSVTAILTPKYLTQTGGEFSDKSLADFEREYLRIMDQAIARDSLNKSETRKKGLDSFWFRENQKLPKK